MLFWSFIFLLSPHGCTACGVSACASLRSPLLVRPGAHLPHTPIMRPWLREPLVFPSFQQLTRLEHLELSEFFKSLAMPRMFFCRASFFPSSALPPPAKSHDSLWGSWAFQCMMMRNMKKTSKTKTHTQTSSVLTWDHWLQYEGWISVGNVWNSVPNFTSTAGTQSSYIETDCL